MTRRRSPARSALLLGAPALLGALVLLAGCLRYEPAPGNVALTFDDGPDPRWTPQVLDVLDFFGVPATFFVVGEDVRRHPGLVAEIHRRGHSVQNQTATHPDLLTLSDAQVRAELRSADRAITDAGVPAPDCLRPPYGSYDDDVERIASEEGLETILWDVDTRDWTEPGVPVIVDAATEAGSRDVILFHDGSGDRSQTVAALPEIIVELAEEGFGFQAVCVEP